MQSMLNCRGKWKTTIFILSYFCFSLSLYAQTQHGYLPKLANGSIPRAVILSFFFQGTFLVLGLYMLLLYIQNRKNDYLWYGLYLLIFTFYYFLRIDSVLKFNLFTTDQTFHHHLLTPLLLLITGVYVNFISIFAEIEKYSKSFAKRLRIFSYSLYAIALSILIYSIFTKDFAAIEKYKHYVLIPMHLYTLAALIRAFIVVKSNIRHYVLWANVFLFTFSIIGVYSAQGKGFSEDINSNYLYGFYAFNASQLGTFLEMLCFSLGLGHKFKLIENEKNEVKQKYIQELKKNEIVTRKLNEELTDLVGQRTKELETKTKLLQEEQEMKSRFYENISHEFRTPLTLIKTPIVEALRTTKPISKRMMQIIVKNTERLNALINDLLSLSKIESGKMVLKMTRRNPVGQIREISKQFLSYAENKSITLNTEINFVECLADYDTEVIEKIVTNLLSNAIKYTPEGGVITLKSNLVNEGLHIVVKDNGIGISKKEQQKIFDRFYQSKGQDEKVSGSGIGLALVKELLHLHNGTIKLDSEVSKGSSFKVHIPLRNLRFIEETVSETAPNLTRRPTKSYKSKAKKHKKNLPIILLVEDNEELSYYLHKQLKNSYNVQMAKDGEEGCEMAIRFIPDLIVSDIMMPRKNGIELCNELKEDERTSHIPIILLTAKGGDDNEISGLKTGADEYMTKPFNEQKLLVRIQKLIEVRRKLRKKYSQERVLSPKEIALSPTEEIFFNRLQKVLNEQLSDPEFNAKSFSEAMNMSRMQLHRKLLAFTDLSTTAFIRSQRLKQALQILRTSDASVNEVAYAVGFNTPSYFIKCFKETYNKTPSNYIQQ